MNIQIFGVSKCFDTKKAQRYFKERGIRFQYCDLKERPMSRGEYESVRRARHGGVLFDEKKPGTELLRYLAGEESRAEKLFENQAWLKTPIVRNGAQATVGYAPEIWKAWK